MITVKPIPADSLTVATDGNGNTGWLHDCGAFTYSPGQPDRCGVCWSANHTAWAFNGQWQKAYVIREEVKP
jgi:hypothetical protein